MANSPESATTIMANFTNQGRMRMWPSAETASWLYNLANIGLVIGLIVGVVSTILLVWMGNIKEGYLNRTLADSRERTEEARAASAEANARAAEANRIAEGERLARVKIEEKLAPRSITPEQIAGLSRRLKPYAGIAIDILQIGESPEITHFRSLIEIPLRAAGLHPLSSTAVGSGSFIGLSVGVLADANSSEKTAATALLSALNAEGIVTQNAGIVKREDWPGFIMAAKDKTANKAPIRIYVGSKP